MCTTAASLTTRSCSRRNNLTLVGGVSVVIVEDNRVFRETLELMLGLRREITVVGSVDGGLAAVQVCAELQPDVVLIDYRMPGMDGAEATREVLLASPRSSVVCLTASISHAEVSHILAAGAVACLTKDRDLDSIVNAIHAAAARPSLA